MIQEYQLSLDPHQPARHRTHSPWMMFKIIQILISIFLSLWSFRGLRTLLKYASRSYNRKDKIIIKLKKSRIFCIFCLVKICVANILLGKRSVHFIFFNYCLKIYLRELKKTSTFKNISIFNFNSSFFGILLLEFNAT